MNEVARLALVLSCLIAVPVQAQSICQLCAPTIAAAAATVPARPLNIDIQTTLDFSIAAHTDVGSGQIEIDAATGERRVSGGLIGLGGPALRGVVTLTGEPLHRVAISLPNTIQLMSTLGARAEVTNLLSTLTPDPTLDANGQLVFSFGGTLTVVGEAAGDFHGLVRITADYQ
jgi:Domain of unknown function (DUF4402)